MKKILTILLLLTLFLAACSSQVTTEEPTATDDLSNSDSDMSPEPSEADPHDTLEQGEKGSLNVDMFGQDLSDKVTVEEISNADGLSGYYATPAQAGNYPGVLMIHEWWGLNDNIKEMARILANEGYNVFAIDLYNGEVAETSERARELATSVRENPDNSIATMTLANEYLRTRGSEQIASLGWCFGGQQSLQISLNDKVDATIIYYGNLVEDANELRSLQGPVLGIFGSEDSSIPISSVEAFESGLNLASVENNIHIYDGVGHAFANPSGSNYALEETVDAWEKTLEFLQSSLAQTENDAFLTEENRDETSSAVGDSPDHLFQLDGRNFKYIMDGQDNPTLRVKEGDTVMVEFTSTGGFHDWVVDELDVATAKVQSDQGEESTTTVTFVAEKKGEFEYYCSVGSHRQQGMNGLFIVE